MAQFRDCRELARLGLQGWSRRSAGLPLVFGSVVHAALERVYGAVQMGTLAGIPDAARVRTVLDEIESKWREENPFSSREGNDDFQLTMLMAESLLPLYFKYWKADDFDRFTWMKLEHEFKLPIKVTLPPIKTWGGLWKEPVVRTFIRGKMDGLYTRKDAPGIRLFETKTKGRIDPGNLEDILPHQLQPGIYLRAARQLYSVKPVAALLNVVRRPALRIKKTETVQMFAERIVEDIKMRPDFYFIRMELNVDQQDFNRFDAEFADLVQDFVMWRKGIGPHYKNDGQCENKHGTCDKLAICGRKFYDGHFIREKVFSELEEI